MKPPTKMSLHVLPVAKILPYFQSVRVLLPSYVSQCFVSITIKFTKDYYVEDICYPKPTGTTSAGKHPFTCG